MATKSKETTTGFVSKKRPQYSAALALAIGSFGLGTIVAWSSPAFPKLALDPSFNLTSQEMSWLAAFVPLGAILGGPLGGYGIERFGRQRTILIWSFPFTIGWIMVAFAHSTMMMMLGRLLTGVCCGVVTLATPIYVSEFAEESIRGQAMSASAVLCSLGLLATNVVGTFISWQLLTILSACVSIVFSAFLFYLPESPVYLLSKGHKKEATRSLMWFRGAETKEQVEPELALMRMALEKISPRRMKLSEFFAPEIMKATTVCMVLMLLQQLSGVNSVIFYSVTIFQSAGAGAGAVSPNLASIIVCGVFLLGVLLFSFLVEKVGRRVLLLLSGLLISISLTCIGYFFYAQANHDPIVDFISWAPLMSLIVFAIAFNIGFGPLPWLMMAELIPPNLKGITSCTATAFNWALAFVVTKSFEDLNGLLGTHGTYWVFAGVSVFGVLFTYLFVPETRGKKLEEIQEFFRGNRTKESSPITVAVIA